MARNLDRTDEQWAVLAPLIPRAPRRADGKGRPPTDRRALLDGILWVLRTGAAWADLPERYPPHTTGHRWFQDWVRSGVLEGVLRALAADLKARGGWDLRECFIDGTFGPAEKGARNVGKTKRGKGTKVMAVADGAGLPVALSTASAAPHEVTRVGQTLAEMLVDAPPERLIGDKAYDSDRLDAELAACGVEMIAPNRANRTKTQDGRALRRYQRRFLVERLFAWLQNFRRLVTRDEWYAENYRGMLHLGCILILLRQGF